ncbi:unnamed protein product [Polarella glacialis]|uniref:EF-hand domain-containing protein n=1 Tax=Polarella glacialis TaxID=89957 RepID=A0A813IPU7_POLGL|nr:unnamed protein product [Polarella glacialis]CAE8641808.1 unnamed protein product [Polarella glacialis]CAE8654820.1 unnamed protein product [Polarella glacialis]|mmetsp:Transcript_77515/g.139851  ORF Transcript_77515/g.139851 Transcript_77515/m.139851 type:complete len:613 (-) Transcript_77515:316-2154(-)|eukprot:CAMPEP_0115080880 /NCGR_PEP_ID=MMETSP0227-20121206/18933_1 /TAXON_ID=89957 /ORGANISM="Polarella glacialis, Strain CCMP 1383" /LENGTH=612 /DNA_ID=CAMNT_0002468591 /DNA_START=165 /DNA_END=2003 /DNA_ORIENTATION=-
MAGQIGQFASLKEGFFACANEHGHFKTGDPDSVRSLAEFLGLDAEIVRACIDEIDADHNGFVTFAEFALWADRHTRNVPLGLAGVAPKSRWQGGMPSYWTTMPAMKDTAEEELSPGGSGARRGLPPGIYSQEQLDQANSLIDLAKFGKWTTLMESLTLRQDLLNVRPPYREYGIIHQAAYFGGKEAVGVLRQLVALEADVHVLTRTGRTALDVAVLRGSHLAVAYLEPLTSPDQKNARQREESAHAILDATKMARWEELFQKLQLCPDLVNARPEPREYAALHQAAFHGDVAVLQRLVDEFKADVCLRSKSGQTALQVAIASEKHQASTYLDSVMPTVHLHDEFVTFPEQVCVSVTDPEMLSRFQALLEDVHKSHNNWTRDRRRATDGEVEDKSTPVPQGYEFVAAFRNENAALWRTYQINREIVKERCEHNASFRQWVPWTASGTKTVTLQGRLDFELEAGANEWFLFHASIPEALRGIARTGFKMAKVAKGADSTGGGLYGEGTYFSDSITKVDEYARKRVALGEEFEGCRTAALCRVIGGRHFYTDSDIEQSDKSQFKLGALQGEYHSTVGDRLKLKNTFREYVVYDGSHAYLEYIIYYKRLGIDEKYC